MEIAELEVRVEAMRRLDVLSWNGLILGPERPKALKLRKPKKASPAEERRDYYTDILGRSPSDDELSRLP